jgi:hypothetical protein
VKTDVYLRRLLDLARLYGTVELPGVVSRALALATYDAAYVQNLLLPGRRRRELHTPTLSTSKRRELIDKTDLEPADPSVYDRLYQSTDDDPDGAT